MGGFYHGLRNQNIITGGTWSAPLLIRDQDDRKMSVNSVYLMPLAYVIYKPAEYQEEALLHLSLWNWRRQNYISGPARAAVRRVMETAAAGVGKGRSPCWQCLNPVHPSGHYTIFFSKPWFLRQLLAFHILWAVCVWQQTDILLTRHDAMPIFILSSIHKKGDVSWKKKWHHHWATFQLSTELSPSLHPSCFTSCSSAHRPSRTHCER